MDEVLRQISAIAMKYGVTKLVLFGSRARGDHTSASDYDIAVYDRGMSALDRACFWADMEDVNTLKKIELVFVDAHAGDDLLAEIERDGVIFYEQA